MNSQGRIMLVDDDITIRSLCAETLRMRGFIVDTAVNGMEALQRINGTAYCAVVSDIEMPLLDGINLYLSAVKAHAYLKNRFVFITGSTSKDIVQRLSIMKRPHLFKPFKLTDMADLVEAVVVDASGDGEAPRPVNNKRVDVRVRLATDCCVFEDSSAGQRFFTARTRNISVKGLKIVFRGAPLIPDLCVRIAFSLKHFNINRKAAVMWSKIIEENTLAGLMFDDAIPASAIMPGG